MRKLIFYAKTKLKCHERLAQLAKHFSKLEHGLVRELGLGKYSRPSNGKKSVL